MVSRYNLRPPNVNSKPVVSVDELRVIQIFNIAFDTGIFPGEWHRIQLSGCYLIMCYTGARPAELVHSERQRPHDVSAVELFGSKVVDAVDPANEREDRDEGLDEPAADETSRRLDELPLAETAGRGRPKALCYEDILMMIVRHPVTGHSTPVMAIKFVHHKGCDKTPKPYVLLRTARYAYLVRLGY